MNTLPDKPVDVLLLTNYRGAIPQMTVPRDGWNLDQIMAGLKAAGKTCTVATAAQLSAPGGLARHPAKSALYASSQALHYKDYLAAVVHQLSLSGTKLFPAFDLFLAHHNKTYQVMRLQRTEIRHPRSFAIGCAMDVDAVLSTCKLPLVGKTAGGYGSRGVELIRTREQAVRFVWKHMPDWSYRDPPPTRSLFQKIAWRCAWRKPFLGSLVLQEFVPGLKGDWKILFAGGKYCGAWRGNRPGDFRASGSGIIDYPPIPTDVLDFASGCARQLRMDWGSLDIGQTEAECYLLEYQAVHFGMLVMLRAPGYYENVAGTWVRREGSISLEHEVAGILAEGCR